MHLREYFWWTAVPGFASNSMRFLAVVQRLVTSNVTVVGKAGSYAGRACAGSITGNSSVTKSTVASHMNLPYTTSPYRVRMDTTFSAPFTGVGYFIGAFDDFVDMHLAALNADGEAVTEDELVISSSYVGYDALRTHATGQFVAWSGYTV